MFLEGNAENTSATLLLFNLSDSFLFLCFSTQINLDWWSFDIISFFGLGHIHAIDVVLLRFDDFGFWLGELNVENEFASHFSGGLDVLKFQSTDFDEFKVIFIEPLFNCILFGSG